MSRTKPKGEDRGSCKGGSPEVLERCEAVWISGILDGRCDSGGIESGFHLSRPGWKIDLGLSGGIGGLDCLFHRARTVAELAVTAGRSCSGC
jgi:hypothetical protein